MLLAKVIKWFKSTLRVVGIKFRLGSRIKLSRMGKPPYVGRGARIVVAPGGMVEFGAGVYIDDYCRIQVASGAQLKLGDSCYFNTNCRIVAVDSICIGEHTMLGPNVCVFDHDHLFDAEGVHGELVSSPIEIGDRCWLCANVLVTKGVVLADRICLGGGSVATRSLVSSGVYAGAPAVLVQSYESTDESLDCEAD